MRRAGLLAFAVVTLGAALALALVGAGERRTLAFTAGVLPQAPVVAVEPGATVCQGPLPVPASFAAVELQVGTYRAAGQPLSVVVREAGGGRTLGSGRLAGGYADVTQQRIEVGAVPAGGRVAVCIRNVGERRVALYGSGDAASRVSTARLDGEPAGVDVTVVLRRDESIRTLALVPDMLERMALFKGSWIGAWSFWTLLAIVLVGVPLLLARGFALAVAAEHDPPDAA
ncbi:MAG TPA: hypothetical protein VFS37_13970 [Conexibacter sp.]|nr:hypothetical protein [Conexibacter sp.]